MSIFTLAHQAAWAAYYQQFYAAQQAQAHAQAQQNQQGGMLTNRCVLNWRDKLLLGALPTTCTSLYFGGAQLFRVFH